MGIIVVGAVVKKDNKYLLVQEAQERCYGKWNLPAGKLDPGETVFDGAKREVFEECGYVVDLTGIATIANRVMADNNFVGIIFASEIVSGSINYNPEEILDVKWFTYDEIMNMQDQLRSPDFIMNAIDAVENNTIGNLNIIKNIK